MEEAQEPAACTFGTDTLPMLQARLDMLAAKAKGRLMVGFIGSVTDANCMFLHVCSPSCMCCLSFLVLGDPEYSDCRV